MQGFPPKPPVWAMALAAAAVAVDLGYFAPQGNVPSRFAMVALVVFALERAPGIGPQGLGFRRRPEPDWRTWGRWSYLLGVAILAVAGLIWLLLYAGGKAPRETGPMPLTPYTLWAALVQAPFLEEFLYRSVFCLSPLMLLGRRGLVFAGGLAFVALHWRYGTLAANHFAAGLALTWAYLRSGSIWVPVLLHFAGNLAVVLGAMALRLLT